MRERYVAARARLEQEAEEREAPVPAGAPGRFAPAPGTAFEKIREGLSRLQRLTAAVDGGRARG